jgi:ABC-2 type transport system ATP-binding protein
MQEVESMCNRVIIINRGKLVADDRIENLQQKLKGGVMITVEFKNPPAENLLAGVQGVQRVQHKQGVYVLTCDTDAREAVSTFAARNNLVLLSMKLEEQSLEDVFQKLTGKER